MKKLQKNVFLKHRTKLMKVDTSLSTVNLNFVTYVSGQSRVLSVNCVSVSKYSIFYKNDHS